MPGLLECWDDVLPLSALAIGSRTAAILLDPLAKYELAKEVSWRLAAGPDRTVHVGKARTSVVFLDQLEPSTTYVFSCLSHELRFVTANCGGLVEATDFGVSETVEDNQSAFAAAISAVPPGGTLRLRAGEYRTGPVFLKPQMTLLLEDGAVLAALGSRENWPKLQARDETGRVLGTWEGLPERCFASVVTALDCDGVTITGRGTIDGGGDKADWWTWPKQTRDGARRPRTVHLAYCNNATISGVTVRNSPSWTIHPYRCDNLQVAAILVENPKDSPNTDGLNPESCRGVDIVGVSFSVGDDCIAIKAGKRAPDAVDHLAPCEDITVRHCDMRFGHGAVVLGSEMSGSIRRVVIENCTFTMTDRGLRFKTRRGRGGVIEDVSMRNVQMSGVPTPVTANAFYFCDADGKSEWVQARTPVAVDETTPILRNIFLENVFAEDVSLAAVALLGLPEAPITGVSISDFNVTYDPTATSGVPLMALGVPKVRHGGVVSEFATVSGHVSFPAKEKSPQC